LAALAALSVRLSGVAARAQTAEVSRIALQDRIAIGWYDMVNLYGFLDKALLQAVLAQRFAVELLWPQSVPPLAGVVEPAI
jgi:hypothetical protein